ncbi:SET domain containing protein [Acanthamoeba castellanii str. Neff]|uniref:SET domain containing protein n=1 Tax=Acanthamoeba castellanii (strain ATCC 30010 / Neff) TaxID=1257118 RepID=L8GYI9_ACACF|nr:SET domain containing protein [Acanthamoeba castellanii str. Neff]ELR17161.1 SET domain containing protein [Acanthamoeba castellanii str. Neff]
MQQLYKPGFDVTNAPWGPVNNAAEDGGGPLDVDGLVRMLQWRDDEGSSCLHLWVVSPSFTSYRHPPAYPFAALDHLLSNYTALVDHDPRLRAALRAALEDCDIMGLTPLHLAGITAPSCYTKLAVAFNGSRRLWLLEQVARAVGADPAPVSYLWHSTPGDLRWVFHGTEQSATAGSDENDAELARMQVERVRVWDRQRDAEEWLDVGELVRRCGLRAYVPFYLGYGDYMRYVLTQILGEDTPQAKKHRLLYAKVIVDAARWDAEQNLVLCWIEEINGYGVFAGRPYHQHEFIALYSGLLMPHEEIQNTDYAFDTIIPGFGVDAKDYRNIGGRFINHSAIPNARSVSFLWKGAPCVAIVALRPIARGEQICYSYAQGASWFHHPAGRADQPFNELLGRPSFPSSLPLPRSPSGEEEPAPGYRCATCLAAEQQVTLKRCSLCHVFKYCSAKCQKEDWPTHKKTCAFLSGRAK